MCFILLPVPFAHPLGNAIALLVVVQVERLRNHAVDVPFGCSPRSRSASGPLTPSCIQTYLLHPPLMTAASWLHSYPESCSAHALRPTEPLDPTPLPGISEGLQLGCSERPQSSLICGAVASECYKSQCRGQACLLNGSMRNLSHAICRVWATLNLRGGCVRSSVCLRQAMSGGRCRDRVNGEGEGVCTLPVQGNAASATLGG